MATPSDLLDPADVISELAAAWVVERAAWTLEADALLASLSSA